MMTTTTTAATIVSPTPTVQLRPPDALNPKLLDLSYIRNQLILTRRASRLEDTILFNLIERSQYPPCEQIYSKPASSELQLDDSTFAPLPLLDHLLRGQERLHAHFHRYDALDEMPFFPGVASKEETAMSSCFTINGKLGDERPRNNSTGQQHKSERTKVMQNWSRINYTAQIRKDYANDILPRVCCFTSQQKACARTTFPRPDADRENSTAESEQDVLGSVAECDIAVLQALSRRIHFGKFVAEAKFQSKRQQFEKLVRRGDVEGIMRAITDEAVEKKVLERLALKAMVYGRDPASGCGRIDVEGVVGMYKNWVIPLTKDVEVEYLLQRV